MCGMKQLVRLFATASLCCVGSVFIFGNDRPSTNSLTVIPPDQSVDDAALKANLHELLQDEVQPGILPTRPHTRP